MKLFCGLFLLGALAFSIPVQAQPAPDPPTYTEPLGIALESWNYPAPVKYFEVEIEGQPARMAYMQTFPPLNALTGTKAGLTPRGTVVLFHGKNFGGYYWGETMQALNRAGYTVIVPDQIGFSKSSKPDVDYSFDMLAHHTARLLDSLGVQKVAVVGHSMGGMLAMRFARNYPNHVEKLVLENPIGLEDYRAKGVPFESFEKIYEGELGQSPEKVRDYYKTYFTSWKPEYERLVEVKARVYLSGAFPTWAKASARTYQMVMQQPTIYDLPQITAPTLLIIGLEDRTAVGKGAAPPEVAKTLGNYPELGKRAAKLLPNAKLVELPGVGHIPHIESPQRFHTELVSFLGAPVARH